MLKRVLSLILAGILTTFFFLEPCLAESRTDREARFAEKVKGNIARLGIGKERRVEVELRDRTKIAGHISALGDESFTVTDVKTDKPTTVSYNNVRQVKGHKLSNRADTIWFIAIAVGIFVVAGIFGGGD